MTREVQRDTQAAVSQYSISKEQFFEEAAKRFPRVKWIEGPPVSKDSYGNPYVTVMIGGTKGEGELPVAAWYDITRLWDAWWNEVERHLDRVCEVQVRWPPHVEGQVDYILETFEIGFPRLVPVPKFQIYSRLSFIRGGTDAKAS